MADEQLENQHSPRLAKNWDKFKSWAMEQNFFPEEIKEASSFQEAVKTLDGLKVNNVSEKEYYDNLHELLQAVEQLYIHMCQIDEKMKTVTRKV
jgi:ribulose bisphosphate carboxylase small subunit